MRRRVDLMQQVSVSGLQAVRARRERVEDVLALAKLLNDTDRLMIEQTLKHGSSIRDLARLQRLPYHVVRGRVERLLKRMRGELFRYVARQRSGVFEIEGGDRVGVGVEGTRQVVALSGEVDAVEYQSLRPGGPQARRGGGTKSTSGGTFGGTSGGGGGVVLDLLPRELRGVARWYVLEGLSLRATAGRTGLSLHEVRKRVMRLKERAGVL